VAILIEGRIAGGLPGVENRILATVGARTDQVGRRRPMRRLPKNLVACVAFPCPLYLLGGGKLAIV
jgi:hypothetical protein